MKKILVVFGTRPEAIKMAPVVKKLFEYKDKFNTKVCITAQHREMLDQVLSIFEINPDFDLDIMKESQNLYDITNRVLSGMREVLIKYEPNLVLVQGDTTTSSFAALAAFYQKIPVGHIEAGLRTGNIYSPWPEEMNRMLTRCLSQHHFAPTELSKKNLLKENVNEKNISVTGNTVIDSLYFIINKIKENKELQEDLSEFIKKRGYQINRERKLILITGHRRENFGEGFINICNAIRETAIKYPQLDLLYPVHLNPNVQKPVYDIINNIKNVYLIEPIEYLPFIYLMDKSYIILTDSGGIQEEAPSLGKPVLVMRDTTERPEAVEAGTVKIVGTEKKKIVDEISLLLGNHKEYQKMTRAHNPYGDGKASQRIINYIINNIL